LNPVLTTRFSFSNLGPRIDSVSITIQLLRPWVVRLKSFLSALVRFHRGSKTWATSCLVPNSSIPLFSCEVGVLPHQELLVYQLCNSCQDPNSCQICGSCAVTATLTTNSILLYGCAGLVSRRHLQMGHNLGVYSFPSGLSIPNFEISPNWSNWLIFNCFSLGRRPPQPL